MNRRWIGAPSAPENMGASGRPNPGPHDPWSIERANIGLRSSPDLSSIPIYYKDERPPPPIGYLDPAHVCFQTWWPNELNLNLLYFILWFHHKCRNFWCRGPFDPGFGTVAEHNQTVNTLPLFCTLWPTTLIYIHPCPCYRAQPVPSLPAWWRMDMIHTQEPENKIVSHHIHIKAQIGSNMQLW